MVRYKKKLAGIFGWSPDKPIKEIFDCLQTHICHGKQFPDGMMPSLYSEVNQNMLWFTKAIDGAQLQNYTFSQIAIGSFLHDIIDLIDAVHVGSSEVKFALYSGHDTTLLPFLMSYRIWDGKWPAYASMLRIEVLTDENSMEFIRIIYNSIESILPDCNYQNPCPYEQFRDITMNIIEGSYLCGVESPKKFRSQFF